MNRLGRKYAPCLVDQKCLARNIIYFSFLIPLHHQIVYEFVIGCATGQSCFVAIEKRCNCLIWASIPYDTILSGYCLFEVIIDRMKGGTFFACQNILDHLFKSVKICNKFTINRLPYVIEKCPNKIRKSGFISTLKKLFHVTTFCNIGTEDINKLRRQESFKFKNAIVINDKNMPRWAERLYNTKTVRNRCVRKGLNFEYTIEMNAAELLYAQRTTVDNEMFSYHFSRGSDGVIKNIFTASTKEEEQPLLIDTNIGEDRLMGKHQSIKKASLFSVGRTNYMNTLEALIVTDGLRDSISTASILNDYAKSKALTLFKEEKADLLFQSPIVSIRKGIDGPDTSEEVDIPTTLTRHDHEVPTNDRMNMSHFTPIVMVQSNENILKSNPDSSYPLTVPNNDRKGLPSISENNLSDFGLIDSIRIPDLDRQISDSELMNKLDSRSMMAVASSLHQCGLITGQRMTPKMDKNTGLKMSTESKAYSIPDEELAKLYTDSYSANETIKSTFSNLCSSTSNTERLISPQLITSMEHIEMRDQLWTPIALSDCDLNENINNTFRCQNYEMGRRISDWKSRLHCTMEKCMAQQFL